MLISWGQQVGLTPAQVHQAVGCFHQTDTDRSGNISLVELQTIMRNLGVKEMIINTMVKMQFDTADRDKSGHIDLKEFLEVYANILKR